MISIYMSYICPIYVLYMSYICPIYVLYMSYICPIYVLYMSYEYWCYKKAIFRVPTFQEPRGTCNDLMHGHGHHDNVANFRQAIPDPFVGWFKDV